MPLIWNIRNLADPDRSAVLRINAQCQPSVASLDETELLRLMALPNHHLAAGHADRSLAGYALAFDSHAPYDGEEFEFFRAGTDGPFLYIDQVATQSGARRAGVGSALYDALEDLARSTDRHLLCCEVNIDPPNPGSMAFHASRGFSEAGVLRTRDGRRVALLIKRLQGNARDATCMEWDRDGGDGRCKA